jgi:hypothetical protein
MSELPERIALSLSLMHLVNSILLIVLHTDETPIKAFILFLLMLNCEVSSIRCC